MSMLVCACSYIVYAYATSRVFNVLITKVPQKRASSKRIASWFVVGEKEP